MTRPPTPSAMLAATSPAGVARPAAGPWIPGGPGKWSKPLRFLPDDAGFVELMRLDPGTCLPLHRHTGEVHALNLEGFRELGTGEIVGPGEYVYEPAGNVDSWRAVGDVPLVVFVVVMGEVEYLDDRDGVRLRVSAATQREEYLRYCTREGIAPHAVSG